MKYQPLNGLERRPLVIKESYNRALFARNFLLAAFWPAVAAAVYIFRYPRERAALGIIVFCAYVGWALNPIPGSDSHTYMLRIFDLKAGLSAEIKEPVIRAIAAVVVFFDMNVKWYFLSLGVMFGFAWSWCARLIFARVPRNVALGLPALFFVCAFFLYYPVFPAVNARYTAAMWVLFAATLLALDGRWRMAAAVALFGMMIHHGHVLFLLALTLLYATRFAKNFQVLIAYGLLFTCIVLPPQFMMDAGDRVASLVGGSLSEAIGGSAHIGGRFLAGEIGGGESTRVWFIRWFQAVLFFGLIVSGHILFWQFIRTKHRNALFQLWVLVIVMWALFYAMEAHPIAQSRLRRNTSGLLLMWHALYFIQFRKNWEVAFAITLVPFLFFYVVAYRIWLHQISLAVFLPLPFGYFSAWWPRVMEALGFG